MSLISIASTMEAAFNEGMETGWRKVSEYYADEVDSNHEPFVPGRDGFMKKEVMIEIGEKEFLVIRQVMPDVHLENVNVKVEENDIVAETSMIGTTPEGKTLSLTTSTVFSFKDDGLIHRIVATVLDLESAALLGQMLMPLMVEADVPRMPDVPV